VFHQELAQSWRELGGRGHLSVNTDEGWVDVDPHLEQHRFWAPDEAFLLRSLEMREVQPGLELGLVELRREPNPQLIGLTVVRVDPRQWRFRLLADPGFERRTVTEVAAEHPDAGLLVNASYFSEDGPVGLLVQDGRTRVPQGSAWAAHFLVEAGQNPRIVNEKETPLAEDLVQGFQGFPAIMSSGVTFSYMRYGGRGFPVNELARRTAVCVDWNHMVWLVVTDTVTNGLTLSETATVLGGLGCRDAMGFDGGGSTQLHVPNEVTIEGRDGVPVFMALEPR
jgi:hypothetical protein